MSRGDPENGAQKKTYCSGLFRCRRGSLCRGSLRGSLEGRVSNRTARTNVERDAPQERRISSERRRQRLSSLRLWASQHGAWMSARKLQRQNRRTGLTAAADFLGAATTAAFELAALAFRSVDECRKVGAIEKTYGLDSGGRFLGSGDHSGLRACGFGLHSMKRGEV
jgi:hypothetical protein